MQDYHRSNIFNLVMTTDKLYSKKKEGTSPETTFRQTMGRDSSQIMGTKFKNVFSFFFLSFLQLTLRKPFVPMPDGLSLDRELSLLFVRHITLLTSNSIPSVSSPPMPRNLQKCRQRSSVTAVFAMLAAAGFCA